MREAPVAPRHSNVRARMAIATASARQPGCAPRTGSLSHAPAPEGSFPYGRAPETGALALRAPPIVRHWRRPFACTARADAFAGEGKHAPFDDERKSRPGLINHGPKLDSIGGSIHVTSPRLSSQPWPACYVATGKRLATPSYALLSRVAERCAGTSSKLEARDQSEGTHAASDNPNNLIHLSSTAQLVSPFKVLRIQVT